MEFKKNTIINLHFTIGWLKYEEIKWIVQCHKEKKQRIPEMDWSLGLEKNASCKIGVKSWQRISAFT